MKYDFKCVTCDHVQTAEFSLDEFEVKKESGMSCRECGDTAKFKFQAAEVGICFRGDAWADKNYKEKAFRKNRSKYMAARQAKNVKTPTLKPNYRGEEAETWTEARDAARDDGKNVASYEPLIHKEARG